MLPKHPVAGPDTLDAVRSGMVDLSVAVTSWSPMRHVLPRIAEFPGAGSTAEINSVAYSRVHWKHLHAAREYSGVHLVGVFTHGPGQMFATKHPIGSLAELEGMRIRTGGGSSEAMVRALGAMPLISTLPQESHALLSSGLADGTFFPQDSFVSFKLDGLVRYATFFPGGVFNYAFGFFMNEDRWAQLRKADQELISEFGGEPFARRAGRAWDDADRLGHAAMRKAGVRIDTASPAFIEELRAKARPMLGTWIRDVKERRGMDGAMLLEVFEDELRRVADGE
jgi:TRAP-type C4-dicarboxylate transport system substrate-binding protein